MTTREKIEALKKHWKQIVEELRELFDAIAATFAMIGYIAVEVYEDLKWRMYAVRRRARKMYRRRRKGRW